MARRTKRLSARSVETLTRPGRHADGDGLYLIVDLTGAKRWAFIFRWKAPGQQGPGKLREMGLGGLSAVSLAQAREKAAAARQQLAAGRNPIEVRKAADLGRQTAITFGAFADALVEDLKHGLRSETTKGQWTKAMTVQAAALRGMSIEAIQTSDVLSVLAPMWKDKSDAASRLRAKIERVLDAAKAKGLRTGENPARWRGHLNKLLPKPQKLTRGHMRALPYSDVPAFVSDLRKRQIATALALEFCILNASRAGEVFGAKWSEVDREARLWIIPGRRMKGGREHRVPLSARSLEILETAESMRNSEYVFPGEKRGRPLSPASIRSLISRMNVATSVHGFRSSFRDWAGECTAFPRDVAEAALAHLVGDETERAYRRADALEKRRKLMDAWARYLAAEKTGGKVVPLAAKSAG